MSPVVIDTNVLVSAVRSRNGASFRLLELVGTGLFDIVVSVPVVLEYEDALLRQLSSTKLRKSDITSIVDYLCSVGKHQEIFFLWRPLLRDPNDDHIAELAVAAGCAAIITYNLRDFSAIANFGLVAITPLQFLRQLGEIK
jgi:putative PIN family toxin of toxin-antitoxin system